jgi:hypothetical protein
MGMFDAMPKKAISKIGCPRDRIGRLSADNAHVARAAQRAMLCVSFWMRGIVCRLATNAEHAEVRPLSFSSS